MTSVGSSSNIPQQPPQVQQAPRPAEPAAAPATPQPAAAEPASPAPAQDQVQVNPGNATSHASAPNDASSAMASKQAEKEGKQVAQAMIDAFKAGKLKLTGNPAKDRASMAGFLIANYANATGNKPPMALAIITNLGKLASDPKNDAILKNLAQAMNSNPPDTAKVESLLQEIGQKSAKRAHGLDDGC